MTRAKKKPKKRQRPKQGASRLPATGDATDTPHTGRAVRGCACLCCITHRRLARQDDANRRLSARYADAPMISEPVWYVHKGGR